MLPDLLADVTMLDIQPTVLRLSPTPYSTRVREPCQGFLVGPVGLMRHRRAQAEWRYEPIDQWRAKGVAELTVAFEQLQRV